MLLNTGEHLPIFSKDSPFILRYVAIIKNKIKQNNNKTEDSAIPKPTYTWWNYLKA
jgi:hypothetical protein